MVEIKDGSIVAAWHGDDKIKRTVAICARLVRGRWGSVKKLYFLWINCYELYL